MQTMTHRTTAVTRLVTAAARLDTGTVADTVAGWVAVHGVAVTWERLISPAWTDLGALFLAERLFSQSVSGVLAAARRPPATVLLACAENEDHVLPLDVLTAALAERGIGGCALGARVPREALADAADRLAPAVVVVWSQHPDTADAEQVTALLVRYPAAVVIPAGPGWDRAALPAVAPPLPGVMATLTVTRAVLGR